MDGVGGVGLPAAPAADEGVVRRHEGQFLQVYLRLRRPELRLHVHRLGERPVVQPAVREL